MEESYNIVEDYKNGNIKASDYRARERIEKQPDCQQCIDEPNYTQEYSGCTCIRDIDGREKCDGIKHYKSKFGVKGGTSKKKKDVCLI